MFEFSVIISASPEFLFALTQDYRRRLEWDPFLRSATLLDGASSAGLGVRACCVAHSGMSMETRYISFHPPRVCAVKMTQGPGIVESFASSWRFEEVAVGQTRVTVRYHFRARPRWLAWVLTPLISWIFARETCKRLSALKSTVERRAPATENSWERTCTQAEADRHNALTAKGWALTRGRLILHGVEPAGPPGWYERWQLRRAIRCFEEALAIHPQSWSSMWALGKIHQRFGDQSAAYDWFLKAHAINPNQPDVAREAGLAALDIGRIHEALTLCQTALTLKPGDAGLRANLALAHCLAGNDAQAERCAAEAAEADPEDQVSATVLAFVRDVAAGNKTRPTRLCDAIPCK